MKLTPIPKAARTAALTAAIVTLVATSRADGAQRDGAVPMPCAQIVADATLTATLGDGATLVGASMSTPGQSSCVWEVAREPTRMLRVSFTDRRGFPAGTTTAEVLFDRGVASLVKAGLKPESVPGIGLRASTVPNGDFVMVSAARADGLLYVTGTGLTRNQLLAVAKQAAAAPAPLLGQHVPVPAPAPVLPAVAMTLEPGMNAWPCVRALTAPDVRSVKRQDVLTEAIRPRPGYSACMWRTTSGDGNGFRLAVATREEFADAGAKTAAEFFALERKIGIQSHEPLEGLGEEALIGGDDARPWILVRANELVITFSCEDCSRTLATSIVQLALARVR